MKMILYWIIFSEYERKLIYQALLNHQELVSRTGNIEEADRQLEFAKLFLW